MSAPTCPCSGRSGRPGRSGAETVVVRKRYGDLWADVREWITPGAWMVARAASGIPGG